MSSRVRRRLIEGAGLGVFVAGTVAVTVRWGAVILMRDWLWVWLLVGLLAISLTDLRRWARGVVVDWLPLIAVIIAYDLLRGAADPGIPAAHYSEQIAADRWIGGGALPTAWLQRKMLDPAHPRPWDYGTWLIYHTHFFATVTVAAVLWRVARERFLRFRAMVATLAFSAMGTFAVAATLPPWLAGKLHHIAPVRRVIFVVWNDVAAKGAAALFESGARWSNEVAAWPSLHAAYPMLLLLFFWRSRLWIRLVLVVYVLAMGFALVYSGEHYVIDVLGGWLYACGAYALVSGVYRLRAAVAGRKRQHDLQGEQLGAAPERGLAQAPEHGQPALER